jgi:hypothetical protein
MLFFEEDNQRNGHLWQGYQRGWNWARNGGSYKSGINFLSIHWEVHDQYPLRVKLHVESPRADIDIRLNLLKNRIIVGILSILPDIYNNLAFGKLEIGSKLFNTTGNKSSEVFHIDLDAINDYTAQRIIEVVNAEIGGIINRVVLRYEQSLKNEGLSATY